MAGVTPIAARRRLWPIIATSAIVLVMLALSAFFYLHRRPKLTEEDTIVLADFANSTGDAVFDGTLRQGVAVQLEQSPFLSLLSEERIQQTLHLMGQPPDARLTPEIARDLCQRTQSAAVIDGSIASLGSQYVLGLKAVNCRTGASLAQEQVQAARKEDALKALGDASRKLRGKLGESLSTVEKFDTPIEQATTPSLDALKAYSLGMKTWHATGVTRAIPFFQRAVDLDPKFAMAYGRLAVAYSGTDVQLSINNMRKAFYLRDRVSERERFYLESHYYDTVTGEWEKAAQAYELWQQIYPRDPTPYDNLQNVYSYLGKHEEALAEALENLRMRPNNVVAYEDAGRSYIYLNRQHEAQALFEQAVRRKLQSGQLAWCRYQLAFLTGDAPEMERLVAATNESFQPWLLNEQAMRESQLGRLRRARELSRQAVSFAQTPDLAAFFESDAGLIEAYLGNPEGAQNNVALAQRLSVNRFGEPVSALTLALAGDVHGAEALSADLNTRWPLDSLVQRYWLPAIRAALSLHRQNTEKAIESLRTMGSYEMSVEGQLDPVYLRGRAYLQQGNGTAAAAEFTKIIEHPGLVRENPIGALAHLGLARAYALQGDKVKGRAAYQDFLTLWKDADPDIPILQQAKAEYANWQ